MYYVRGTIASILFLGLSIGLNAQDLPTETIQKQSKEQDKKKAKADQEKKEKALKSQVDNLKDPNPEIRANAANMLGILGDINAVPHLIEALRDKHIMVQINAHGALNKITGKNFGYKNYSEWHSWWVNNEKEFRKKGEVGTSEMNKIGARTSNTQGLMYLRNSNFAMAKRMFLDAVNKDPEIPDYRNNLGLAMMEMGQIVDAMVFFEETIGLDPNLPQPYMNIGNCFAKLDRHIEAQHWFQQAMQKDTEGKLWEPFWLLGRQYLKKKEFTLALEYLDQAYVKAQRNRVVHPPIYRDLALTHFALDQYFSAWKEIKRVEDLGYQLDPDFVEKVRRALVAQGVDPDKREEQLRAQVTVTE